MKCLFLLLLSPLAALAQQDFDYTLFTRHSQHSVILNKDSTMSELVIERRIVKEGSRLSMISCMNTGNSNQYTIQFQGVDFTKPVIHSRIASNCDMMSFEYTTDDGRYNISIWPTIPLVEFHELKTGKFYCRFY